MTSTAILAEDATALVEETCSRFSWGVAIAGAMTAIATTFFLLTMRSGIGLALASPAHARSAGSFLTLGAIYFFASQAFGFAVGGYMVGRLIGPEGENSAEEEFLSAAHGFVMWALVVVVSILVVGFASALAGATIAGAMTVRSDNPAGMSEYWVDTMFRSSQNSPQLAADKAEVGRILSVDGPTTNNDNTARIAHLVAEETGLSMLAATSRVSDVETRMQMAANDARKAASMLTLWTAFSLLFGAIVAVAASISARWMDDRISFSLAPRR